MCYLFVLKIEGIFEKRKNQPKIAKRVCFLYIYRIDTFLKDTLHLYFLEG